MPNWCENDLHIYGSDNDLTRLKTLMQSEDSVFDFNRLIPRPEEFEGVHTGSCVIDGQHYKLWRVVGEGDEVKNAPITEEERAAWLSKYGSDNWYDWCCANWGTKWNSSDVSLDEGIESLDYRFNTAWSPPEPVIKKLAKLFPDCDITHEYYECGACFQGGICFTAGEPTKEWSGEYYGTRGG